MARKHIPLRTCVACRQIRAKRELVRIVKPPEGQIFVDEKGKAAGRGAYLCRRRACWQIVMQQGRLEHALRAAVSAQEREALLRYAEHLPEDSPATDAVRA